VGGLKGIAMPVCICTLTGKETRQLRFSISTLPGYVDHISRAAGKHWPIENGLHGILEAALKDDHRHVHEDQAPENLSCVIPFSTCSTGKTAAAGIHIKQLRATRHEDSLAASPHRWRVKCDYAI
jgi:hypothetical protein